MYVFDDVVTIHESHREVRNLIGARVLRFQRDDRSSKLYLYAGPSDMVPVQDAIAISPAQFDELLVGLEPHMTKLEVQSTVFLWSARPLRDEAIPRNYRDVMRTPLERFAVPREEYRDSGDSDSLGDFMFMSMFPDVAPLYRPNSFLAWYMWYQHQPENIQHDIAGGSGQFDGGGASGDWDGTVPGFPTAASQRMSIHGDGKLVELLDASGTSVGSFIVTENNHGVLFRVPGGHEFTVTGQSDPTIEYAIEAGQRFSWDGQNDPVVETLREVRPELAQVVATEELLTDESAAPAQSVPTSSATEVFDERASLDSNTSY